MYSGLFGSSASISPPDSTVTMKPSSRTTVSGVDKLFPPPAPASDTQLSQAFTPTPIASSRHFDHSTPSEDSTLRAAHTLHSLSQESVKDANSDTVSGRYAKVLFFTSFGLWFPFVSLVLRIPVKRKPSGQMRVSVETTIIHLRVRSCLYAYLLGLSFLIWSLNFFMRNPLVSKGVRYGIFYCKDLVSVNPMRNLKAFTDIPLDLMSINRRSLLGLTDSTNICITPWSVGQLFLYG